ncbi:MAG: hypothetical protein GWN71_00715, partial [Gammaproteobacteria bacterium]|nr:hypothetical protein [Gemmatimonadota bacterium]NIR34574.1 hypothetical protein [Actinomycetota bacterium]NIT85589.1 hypothetical protein [Gemmatimonadota bacterium]NIU72142.1 hypothetical protein [Gammaproteobacteria bacterium]NIX37882.1 hypothetical protein [Gemmatimonadota bacterium]
MTAFAVTGIVLVGGGWVATLPLLLLWSASPVLVSWLGRPVRTGPDPLPEEAHDELRRLARRTWAYFDNLISPADHWLPPDNVQLHPIAEVARR